MNLGRVTVFGGSGFIGRHLVRRLAAAGAVVRVAVRDPEAAMFLKTMGDVGQIVPMRVNVRDEAAVAAALEGVDAAVNLVGILYEGGRQRFDALHATGAGRLAALAAKAGVKRLVHVSALGAAPDSPSHYGRSKAEGERAVREAFPAATILRPSVVFGPEDKFFNRFAALARISWVLPVYTRQYVRVVEDEQDFSQWDLYGDGGTKFQPIFVGDVADAAMAALGNPMAQGQSYDLGGPRVYTFKALMELLLQAVDRKRLLLPLPLWVAEVQGAVLQWLPVPPLTRDQAKLLRVDNVVPDGADGLAALGIEPTSIDAVLPTYMDRHRRQGRFASAAQA